MVYAVPNDASTALLNVVGGTVVVCDRGAVSFVDKARNAQTAGAKALVIVDTFGVCSHAFECSDWLGSRSDGVGVAARDPRTSWEDIIIPVVLVTKADGERLRTLMALASVDMGGTLGVQFYVPDRASHGL
jgi:hypothetical protein